MQNNSGPQLPTSKNDKCATSCADFSAGDEEATVSLTGAGMQMFEFDGEVELKTTVLSISEEPAPLELTIFSRTNKQQSLDGVVFIKPTTHWAMHRSACPVEAMSVRVASLEPRSGGCLKRQRACGGQPLLLRRLPWSPAGALDLAGEACGRPRSLPYLPVWLALCQCPCLLVRCPLGAMGLPAYCALSSTGGTMAPLVEPTVPCTGRGVPPAADCLQCDVHAASASHRAQPCQIGVEPGWGLRLRTRPVQSGPLYRSADGLVCMGSTATFLRPSPFASLTAGRCWPGSMASSWPAWA